MPPWWTRNSHRFTTQDHKQQNEEHNHKKKKKSNNNSKASATRSLNYNNNNIKEKYRKKPKSFDESILLAQSSLIDSSHELKDSSMFLCGSSLFPGSNLDARSEAREKKAYPLPTPSSSSEPSERVLHSITSSSVSSSTSFSSPAFNDDDANGHEDFCSFRGVEETRTSCSPEPKGFTTCTLAWPPSLWDAGLESPSEKQENGKHPCHRLPLPPASPNKSPHNLKSNWKKGKLIGRGTFGHVYAGFNSENGQMCAMKEVRVISDDKNSNESLKQLNQEIALLSELSHPNIVQYYGSKLGGDTLLVFLEYVSGGSIQKLLTEYGSFTEPVIRSYTKQILSGLAYLHGRNTVHRDIKGANILVDPNGEIKLVDFGMAKHITSCSSMLSFKGSPYWMAPEVIMNTSGYSLAVDIWSLGCTVLEMATSKPPWSQYEGVAAMFKIANSKNYPEIPNYLSEDVQNFVKVCLQRDPSARPTATQLLHHPFIQKSRHK